MPGQLVGIYGSQGRLSKTYARVTAVANRAAARFGRTPPLFHLDEFASTTLPTDIHAASSDFTDGQPAAPPMIARALGQLVPWFGRTTVAHKAA